MTTETQTAPLDFDAIDLSYLAPTYELLDYEAILPARFELRFNRKGSVLAPRGWYVFDFINEESATSVCATKRDAGYAKSHLEIGSDWRI